MRAGRPVCPARTLIPAADRGPALTLPSPPARTGVQPSQGGFALLAPGLGLRRSPATRRLSRHGMPAADRGPALALPSPPARTDPQPPQGGLSLLARRSGVGIAASACGVPCSAASPSLSGEPFRAFRPFRARSGTPDRRDPNAPAPHAPAPHRPQHRSTHQIARSLEPVTCNLEPATGTRYPTTHTPQPPSPHASYPDRFAVQ